MCDSPPFRFPIPRRGSALEHGPAHAHDHHTWSRRDFLTRMALGAAGVGFTLAGQPVRAFSGDAPLHRLAALETDRILVLVQLGGGNDGLNTVVPYGNDVYYRKRPVLAIPPSEVLALDDRFGLHPALGPLGPLWAEGQMGIVLGVGYPEQNLSHFRSTDIWVSASDAAAVEETGWIGRYLDHGYPAFAEAPTDTPLAVQIGTSLPLLFQGPAARMGLSFHTVGTFESVAQRGEVFDPTAVPASPAGDQLAFMRRTANQTIRYGKAVRSAYLAASNLAEYPTDTYRFGRSLATVARSIRGRLGAKIYVVSLPDFDTHVNQAFSHSRQLSFLAAGLRAFYDDLATDGLDANVLTVTFSEFGRRVEENASQGTDHGSAAPLFVFGPEVRGGFYGAQPSLENLDHNGNMRHAVEFRNVYATLLAQWFGLEAETVSALLGLETTPTDFLRHPAQPTSKERSETPGDGARLLPVYPNPFRTHARIAYELPRPTAVRLQVFDVQGRLVATLVDGRQTGGRHEVDFRRGALPSGSYLLRLETQDGFRTRTVQLLR